MASLERARVIVAGAGALGASIAVALARAGARVVLADPAGEDANASSVAAGMLAPAFEAPPDEYAVLRDARDAWPAFAATFGDALGLRRSGAVWIDLPDEAPRTEALARGLAAAGAAHALWGRADLERAAPGLNVRLRQGLFTPEDWRLEPVVALAAMRRAAADAGAVQAPCAVAGFADGQALFSDGSRRPADALVLATGAAAHELAPEIGLLSPIKGHILTFAAMKAGEGQPCLRTARGYAVPASGGLRVGATMEPGVVDAGIDPRRAAPLGRLGGEFYPALDGANFEIRAGVRATTPDGWPLVGPSVAPGVWLAGGARRNGWLLAPLVASMTAAYLAGDDPGPHAPRFAPVRFAASRHEGEDTCRASG